MSGNMIAKVSKTSARKIYEILQHINITWINEAGFEWLKSLDEIYLWVDEHAFSVHDMILIITELKTKKLIAVIDGITKEKLESWINSLPLSVQLKIRGYSTDMNKGYRNALDSILSHPVHSVDKFHLFQEANRMVDDVRALNSWLLKMSFVKADEIIATGKIPKKLTKESIKEINDASGKMNPKKLNSMKKYKEEVLQRLKADQVNPKDLKNSKWETVEYKEITLDYFLETGYRKLFMTREQNLSGIQKLRLNQVFAEFDYRGYLAETWTLKEDFMDAINARDVQEVNRIIQDCKESEHHRIQQFGRTLTNWYSGIKGYCEHSTNEFKFTNALTEGINNSCKVAKRQSHGFKNKDNYLRKIFVKCILKNTKENLFSLKF